MPKSRHLTKQDILAAMGKNKSNRAAARYINCSYIHYKKWAKLYEATDPTYPNLFEQHKNQCGKGIPKFLSNTPFGRKVPAVLDIIEGRLDPSHFNPQKIKYTMIEQGYLKEECYSCGFHERRVIDYKMPLILHFKNGKHQYGLDNVQLLCHNCMFLYYGSIYNDKDLEQLEDHKTLSKTTDAIKFETDDYTQQRLKELGLFDKKDEEDPYNLVSYKS